MRKNLFLFLALACFGGLLAIFMVDGYLGIYDTVYITAGEREERIEADSWLRQEKFGPRGVRINRGEKALFRYELDNRQFSSYSADIEVSLWHSQEKVLDLLSQPISIAPFEKGQVEWVIDAAELLPEGSPAEQTYNYTVTIKRGKIERRIIVNIVPSAYLEKRLPVPVR